MVSPENGKRPIFDSVTSTLEPVDSPKSTDKFTAPVGDGVVAIHEKSLGYPDNTTPVDV